MTILREQHPLIPWHQDAQLYNIAENRHLVEDLYNLCDFAEKDTMLFLQNVEVCPHYLEWNAISQNAKSTQHMQFCFHPHCYCGLYSPSGLIICFLSIS